MHILLLSSWFPYPPDNGSKTRAWYLLNTLAQKHDVTLLTFVREGENFDVVPLERLCDVAAIVPRRQFRPRGIRAVLGLLSPAPRSSVDTYSLEMARHVRKQTKQSHFDIVVALELGTGIYKTMYPRIGVLDDLELSVIRDQYLHAPNALWKYRYGLTWLKTRRHAQVVLSRFSACTVVSVPELDILKSILPEYRDVSLIPNGVDLDSMNPDVAVPEPNTLIYNGALTYSANYDAMDYFLTDIWGRVKAAEPRASLQITGKSDGVDLDKLPFGTGVRMTGYLPDIRPAVAGAWAVVVPLRTGGGTRLKILEAMALGTPVVATSKGAEGLDVTPEENILIADCPTEFAAHTVRLLRSEDLRRRLADNGRRLVEEKYNWRVIGDQFNQLVESVANKGQWA